MKRSIVEVILGGIVLFVAAFFLLFSYKTADIKTVDGYELTADFSGIGGLSIGDDVLVSGVKVGSVKDVALDMETYLARVTISVRDNIMLPEDTAAMISSESLLGGKYMQLEPGGAEDLLKPGDRILYTQAPQNLEQLLGQFIFNMQGQDESDGS